MMKFFEKNIIGRIVLKVCLSPMMKPYFGAFIVLKVQKSPGHTAGADVERTSRYLFM